MVLSLLHKLLIALEVLFIFNLLIVVHELGHFLAARWRGLVVDEFGIWFGKSLWRKKIGGVWFSLGSIPAGGFVKLPQLAPMEAIEGESESRPDPLPPISPLDKILVALAGPVFSFLLALAMACVVWTVGKPLHEYEKTTTLGFVQPGGPADRAGLRPGDRILEVDGQPVDRFVGPLNSVMWRVIRSEGEKIPFKIEREGQILTLESSWEKAETAKWQRNATRKVLIRQQMRAYVGGVERHSPAEQAGLLPGDLIVQVRGVDVAEMPEFYKVLGKESGQPVPITVDRHGQRQALSLTPSAPARGAEAPETGIFWGEMKLIYPSPIAQVADAVLTIRNMLDALFSPKSDVKAQHFSGPVGILKTYYGLFESEEGWRMAIAFSVFFNVNLALFNMLPFPVLDGGHITLAILESIRRKPVNGRALEWIQTACAFAVMAFLAYVSFFDISDSFSRKKSGGTPKPASSAPGAPSK